MSRPLPLVDAGSSIEAAFELLSDGRPALIVVRDREPAGIATRVDLLEYLNRAYLNRARRL